MASKQGQTAAASVDRRRVLTGGAIGAALLASAPHMQADDTPKRASSPPIVLVHGAWHGGWCWRDVRAQLSAEGRRVFTPTLTGLGERAHLLSPDIGLTTHIQDVIAVLEAEELQNVILVGHSYGGMIITGVADALRDRLKHVIYLDAAVPRDGQSMHTQGPPLPAEILDEAEKTLRALAPDGVAMAPLPPMAFGMPEENTEATAWLARRLAPHPLKTWLDPIGLQNGGSDGLPRTYVHCTQPVLQPSAMPFHAAKAQADDSWAYVELKTGHDAMVTAPEDVANVIRHVA